MQTRWYIVVPAGIEYLDDVVLAAGQARTVVLNDDDRPRALLQHLHREGTAAQLARLHVLELVGRERVDDRGIERRL